MRAALRLLLGLLAGISALSLPGQTITSVSYTYDTADVLVQWTFTLDEGAYSSSNVGHIVLGFDGPDGSPPPVAWVGVGDVTVNSSSFAVTNVDVWTDSGPGRSYLELNLNTPLVLDGNGTTFNFSLLTGGINNLGNAPSATFFVELRSGTALMNAGLDGALIVSNNIAGSPADLTAVPEPATYALFAGVAMLGFALVRRSRRTA